MKKFLFTFALMIALTSCGGRKTSTETVTPTTDTVETTAVDTVTVETPVDTVVAE